MTATLFDGTSSVSILNSTGLAFTGDMSISLWFDPSENDTYSSSGTGWQQLIGKGQTTSPGSESGRLKTITTALSTGKPVVI